MSIHHLIATYGDAAVFLLVMLESLGIPLPGETILIAAGTYAGTTHKLSVWAVFAVAAAGAIIGDNLGYWIGDKGGYRLLRRYGPRLHLHESRLKVGRLLFDRHGGKVVFFGRFVSILRTYAAFLAGANKLRWRRFLLWNALGGILWSAVYTFASYGAGNVISKASTPVDIGLGVAAAVAVAVAVVVIRRRAERLTAEAESAYPGPLPDR